jgi:hypothetical protein
MSCPYLPRGWAVADELLGLLRSLRPLSARPIRIDSVMLRFPNVGAIIARYCVVFKSSLVRLRLPLPAPAEQT